MALSQVGFVFVFRDTFGFHCFQWFYILTKRSQKIIASANTNAIALLGENDPKPVVGIIYSLQVPVV